MNVSGDALKMGFSKLVLTLLVVQSTSIVLLMRYSKTHTNDKSGPPYVATAAVLAAELLKLPTCLLMAAWTLGGFKSLLDLLRNDMLGAGLADTFKCGIPAVAYTIQGNLLFLALANLEAPTYQVSYQCKTLFTALFSYIILNRQLKTSQWIALLLLVLGTVLVLDPWKGGRKMPGGGHQVLITGSNADGASIWSPGFVGLAAVFAAAILSASSSVYFELLLKKKPASPAAAAASLWLRNIQLGVFATPLAAMVMVIHDGEFIFQYGILQGFDGVVWVIVLLNGLGGLLVAATMKYADNIAKCFATAIAIVSGTLLSVPIFSFHLSTTFGMGATCTVVASVVYSMAPDMACEPRRADVRVALSAIDPLLSQNNKEDDELYSNEDRSTR